MRWNVSESDMARPTAKQGYGDEKPPLGPGHSPAGDFCECTANLAWCPVIAAATRRI